MTWRQYARCRGLNPAIFYPERGDRPAVDRAIAICRRCTVTNACLQDALDTNEIEGIRGALTSRERRIIKIANSTGTYERTCLECSSTFLGQSQSKICSPECRQVRNLKTRRATRNGAA